MRDKKYYIALDDFERRVIVNCLNEMRNNLIANGKYTDAVDEVLLKIIDAKQKKFKVIYKQAEDMLSRLVEQMAEREGVTEERKANSQMEWVARMNNISSRATETVNHDIIYG